MSQATQGVSGLNIGGHRYWQQGWYVWNNDWDTAKLMKANGTVADTCSFGGSSASAEVC